MIELSQFENALINFSFFALFLNTLIIWIGYNLKKEMFKQEILIFLNCFPSLLTTLFFLTRWYTSGHFPISNLYESLIFLSLSINVSLLSLYFSNKNLFIYAVSLPVPLLINAFATFCLPEQMQTASPLIPALKSNWLLMHVTVMIISYASLIIGSLFSIAFLVMWVLSKNAQQLPVLSEVGELNKTSEKLSPILDNLDNLSYRFIGISFPFLTIGILSGAVWANETWGSYWNWDPKETWALITWLVFAIYLHSRLIKGWRGFLPSLIGAIGFVIVWICYLGVNLLGKGLHSYGWFNS